MKQRLLIFIFGFLYWTLFFLVGRALFLLSESDLSSQLSGHDILLTFVYGVRMDFTMAGYWSLIPGLMLAFTLRLSWKPVWRMWFAMQLFQLIFSSIIISLDFELYKHWGFRMDATPLLYVSKAAVGSISIWRSLTLVLYVILISGIAAFVLRAFFLSRFKKLIPTSWIASPILFVATSLMFIPIRSSFGVAPMNTGFVYFHPTNMFANHAAVNVVWNFGYSLKKVEDLHYPDKFFDRHKTTKGFAQLFDHDQTSPKIIKGDKPNVIIIVLESFTYRFIEPLGGIPGVAPNFTKLSKEGVLFDNFYASGDRTDKGLLAVLSAYPALPLASIVKYPNKSQTLAFLNQPFKAMGYRTEFTFGNDIDFANFRSYLVSAQFDHLTHSADFPAELNTGKWGVQDQYVFDRFFEEAEAAPKPFFKTMLTLSSHEPYDVPMETVIEGDDHIHRFMNSAYYTDKCLGEFIEKAKQTSWWENTLVIITADHGHPLPDNQGIDNIRRFKIPMLWLGGALAAKDTVIHTIGGQTDIANTLLGQFDKASESFQFSNNLLAPHTPFAVFIFNNGFGMVDDQGYFVFDNVGMKITKQGGEVTREQQELGKAYIQKLYWDFNSR